MSVKSQGKHCAVLALIIATVLCTVCYKADGRGAAASTVRLSAIPAKVGAWTMQGTDGAAGKKEASFLNDVLYRTYRRDDGATLVLAVAYGADQRKKFNLHLPETCYKASGYQVFPQGETSMHAPELKLKQLLVKDAVTETQPVQYWIMLDGKQVNNELEKRLKHLYYSVAGAAADGVLVRVSSMSAGGDGSREYAAQQEFIGDLYRSLDPGMRKVLFGRG